MPLSFRRRRQGDRPLDVASPEEDRKILIRREELAVLHDPRSQIAEQFRGLRNSILALNPDGAPRSIVLTSAVSGEGKTIATLNLAIALAELPGTEVVVVDGDLREPSVERYLGLPLRQGLTDVLAGRLPLDEAIRPTSLPAVSIIGAGNLPENPSQLIGSDRMRTVLNTLKRKFSYVLVDTPEAMTISDASLIGAMADGIVLVVRLGVTPRHLVEQTYNTLESLGGNVLGTCVTGAAEVDTAKDYTLEGE